MGYIKKYDEVVNEHKSAFQVCVKWMHGDADFYTDRVYYFSTEEMMRKYLDFIFDVRKFKPHEGYKNVGYFEDGYHQGVATWVKEIADKHNPPNFIDYMEIDGSGMSEHYASVEKIYVKIGGKKKYIVWSKALETNIISLPEKGSIIDTNSGQICGHGKETFGGKTSDYLYHWDLKKIYDEKVGEYTPMKLEIIDIKIANYNGHDNDYQAFKYEVLCKIPEGIVTTEIDGYDPDFEKKYNKEKWDGLGLYLV